ncbi:MAG: PaaI family thioesterase [Myxococcota bacterium]|nr:PaaI family thioesterase [Myxococcota bacterium]
MTEIDDDGDFIQRLGCTNVGIRDGAYIVELDLDERHMSIADRAHGGVLFSLLDTALGRSIIHHLPEGRGCATVEMKVNYFRPIQRGRIQARASMKELTRSLAYAEGEIRNEANKVLARASGTFFLTETVRQQDRERV